LYADGGPEGKPIGLEAIEALVRVAGLTVELLASAPVARPASEVSHETEASQEPVYDYQEETVSSDVSDPYDGFSVESAVEEVPQVEDDVQEVEFTPQVEEELFAEAQAESVEDLTDTVPVVVDESLDDESYLMSEPEHEHI